MANLQVSEINVPGVIKKLKTSDEYIPLRTDLQHSTYKSCLFIPPSYDIHNHSNRSTAKSAFPSNTLTMGKNDNIRTSLVFFKLDRSCLASKTIS